jgi:hypothetical protein
VPETGALPVTQEKKTFFSWLPICRSEDGGQGRALFARRASGRSPLKATAAKATRAARPEGSFRL